ncbi:glutathione S-transferase family protein [Vibrio astriarenae]|uniref:Glutathione S-transferase family protein n=1 Tax=Vibrio astriarenae TaxID=1481923 RepID=A0A7Z2T420_9VIBR|nr:glutathione S-transferase family protein [Vibrio astriarenae]QIA63880.1 glutathione S-transferase family protein [Vibrio astriarenae]
MVVYGDIQSGNCFKVKLLLSLLDIEHEWRVVDVVAKETQTKEFLALSPKGKIPIVVLDDGKVLSESNAILGYFAEQSDLLPHDRFEKAKVYEWLFFEQYSHEPYIAVARFINKYLGMPREREAEYESLQAGGHSALAIMEKQLNETSFLVGSQLSIADLSLYAYTHVAHEGGFDLSQYPAVLGWIERIQTLPNYIGME